MFVRTFRQLFARKKNQPIVNSRKVPTARKRAQLRLELLEDRVVPSTITAWTFENNAIAVNNSPAPSTGTGTASGLGMTNSYNSTTSTNTDDVLQGATGDTGANAEADTTQIWRVRGQSPGNGWSSQAPIATQGAEFAASTVNYAGPINISFDWYATTQGEANLQLEYTTDGSTWNNVPITIGANSTKGLTALTNSSSSNTVMGSYISDNKLVNGSQAGQDWFQGLTATINDSAAANDPNFAIELVNASTGADCLSTQGTALNNSSGNWRFDNISISGTPQSATPTTTDVPTFTPDGSNAYGTNETFTAVVHATNGSTAPTAGSVTFESGSTVLATATTESGTSGTVATFTVSTTTIPVGTYAANTITAVYNPGTGFSGSTSSASTDSLTITGTATTTAVPTFTPTTVTVGAPVTFTAVVTASTGATAPTAGSVVFESGSTVLATATSETTSGTHATFTVSSNTIPVGSYPNITAVYSGNGAFTGSTSNASGTTLTVSPVQAPQNTIAQWTFENDAIAVNNSPAPSIGVGTASAIGMTNSYNGTTSTNTDDVTAGASGDTGSNGLADLTNIWRVRGQSPGNGWSSQAPIGTQGAVFATSTVGHAGPINVSFDWYATTQGEANLQLEYTTDGTTWINVPITVPAGDADIAAKTNSSSSNTVNGSYIQMSGGQQWAPGLTATINDPNAANHPNFAIELVNASTGADDISASGGALNNTSGNWRFDNIDVASAANYAPGDLVLLQAGDGVTSYNAQGPLYLNEIGTAPTVSAITGTTETNNVVTVTTAAYPVFQATNSGTTVTLEFNTGGVPVPVAVNQQVAISGVAISGSTNNPYNGTYTIQSVGVASDGNPTITYTASSAPSGSSDAGSGSVATDTYAIGQQVQISGVQIGSTINSQYNGVFVVTGVSGATFTYSDPAAANLAAGTPAPNVAGATGGAFAYSLVQQSAIPAVGGVGNAANQPVTIDLSAAAGNGQLTRSSDGSALNFDGVDSTVNNGGLTAPTTPTGQDNRDIGVVTGNPNVASDYNTTTQGPFYVGDDNRGSVTGPGGQIWAAGHPNQAGGAVSQGVHYFPTTGPSTGTQVSASTNIRGINIGFDTRVYFSTASGIGGATILNTAGIFTDAQALPTAANPTTDIQVVPALFGASKLGGVYFADVNGDGIVDNGDKLYFLDDGTVGGTGTGGIYVSTWNDSITWNAWNTPNNVAAAAAGFVDHWSVPVKIGDAPVQNGAGGVGQLRGITGTVLGNGTVELYTTAYDNAATTTSSDNSIIQQWVDPNAGFAITKATESGTTVTITTLGNPNWVSGVTQVQIDGVVTTTGTSNGLGLAALTGGYNGVFTVTGSGNTWTYTDTHSGLAEIDNAGAAEATVSGAIIAEANAGVDAIGSKNVGDIGLRGVAFAPVAATNVTLSQSPANPLTPGSAVTLTAVLTNPEAGVNLNGDVVTFIDQNTNTILGQATVGAMTSNEAILNLPTGVIGNHYVQAYFAGGGTQALASARSNTIQIVEAGDIDTWVQETTSGPIGAGVGSPVTFTATVHTSGSNTLGSSDTVSFYNGSVSTANLLGTTLVNPSTGVATLTTAFSAIGTDTILAVFNGDNNFESSQVSVTQKIGANATGTISSSANNVALNATPTYTATVNGNATVGAPNGTVTFTLVSATTGAVVGTSSATNLTISGNSGAATWTSPALASPGSYFVTFTYAPATGTLYNGFTIDTISSTNGTAFVETVKQAFTPGNLVAVQRGDGNINLGSSGYLVFLDEYTTAGNLVQRIALPNLDASTTHALLLSGQNAGEGLLNRSANGAYLTVAGYDVPVGRTFLTSTFPYQFPRTIGLISGDGTVNTTTAIGVANSSGSGVPAAIKSATATGTGTGQTVTITLTASNFFMAGQSVTIAGITDGSSGTAYDGTFTITAASGTTLSYVDSNNITSTSPTVSSATASSPASVPYNPSDVVTNDGQSFYLGSNLPVGDTIDSGILYVASVGATTATEIGPVGTSSASIGIAGGQLYSTTGSGKLTAVGTGLPTTIGQTLTGLPSFAKNYDLFFHNAENAEEFLLLNTNDGSTNNPNVAYVADQANGLLKFTLFSASGISLNDPGTGVVTATYTGNALAAGQYVAIANASDPTFDGTFQITSAGSGTFTFNRGGTTAGSATGATATEWVYGGKNSNTGMYDGTFGQKLVFAGGVTAVTGYVVNPGPSAQVQLYMTGVNVQQQNPNQLDSWLDPNGGTAGFTSGNVSKLAFVGGSPTSNPASPNGNENFAGLAFAPGYVTGTVVAVTGNATAGYSVAATVTDPTGGSNVPTGAVYFYLDGSSTAYGSALLNGSGVATLTIAAGALTGEHSFTAVYQGDVKDDQSTGVSGQAFGAGNLIATVSAVGANANGAATSVSEFQTSGGSAVQTIYLPTVGAGGLTEKGNTTSEGYLSDSADGHSASFAGYLVDAGSSTTGANAAIAVLQANGSVSTTTQIASSDIGGSVRAAVSADGKGFWVASANYLRYVPFGNSSSTPSTLVSNYYPGPSTVEIQTSNDQFGSAGQPGTLYITGAAGSPGGGLSSIDGPAQVLGGLATVAGQAESTLGNGGGSDFNTGRDTAGNFPASNQIAVSPDGLTIFVADGRTDGSGGILEYTDTLGNGSWALVGQAQVDGTSDGGLVGLVADFSTPSAPVIYATTSGTTSNRIEKITGGTTNGNPPSFSFATLETSPSGSLFHGVAFAPKAAAAAASKTTATVTTTGGGFYADSSNNVTLSATVADNSGGTGDPTPTGYVSFQTAAGVEIGSAPLVNGTATLKPVSDLVVAQSGTINAVYTGDSFYAGSNDNSKSATVAKETTTTTLTDQFTSVATGVTDNLSAQVTFTGSNAAPTGTVTFWQDAVGGAGTKLGTANVTATIVNVNGTPTLEFLASGVSDKFTNTTGSPHPMFAVYSGDTNFATSTSPSNPITVVLSPTIAVTTNNANPANTGVSVTETVTVSGSPTPTGYVQFYDNLVPIGSPVMLSGGTASVTVTTSATQGVDGNGNQFLLPGMQSITAVYSGDGTYFSGSGVNEQAVQANAFGAGDKFVYRVGDGVNSLDAPTGSTVQGAIGSTIYIDEINPTSGLVVQSIILPSADGTGTQSTIHAIVGNGQQSSTEQLSVDGANSALWLTGYDTNPLLGVTVSAGGIVSGQGTLAPGIPTVSGSITRAVARITTAGVVQDVIMSKTNSGSGFGNFNAVFSPDGNSFYAAGNGGVVYFSSFTPSSGTVSPTATMSSPTGTTTALENDGGNLAIIGAPGFGNDGPQIYSGFPTSAASVSNLPGFSDAAATAGGQASTFYVDAYFTHLDNAGGTAPAGINTFYLSDDGPSFAQGAITKWSLVGGVWQVTAHITAPGAAPNPISYYYISGQTLSEGTGSSPEGNVTLYVTYGNGGNADTGPGQLFTITDNSGYQGTGLTAGAVINQTGTASNEVYRGVAMFGTTDLTGTAMTPTGAIEGTAGAFQVATFTDPDDTTTAEPITDFTVTINWGDGTTSAGTLSNPTTNSSGSTYIVSGSHTYAEDTAAGHAYPVTVTINDDSWSANLILKTTATVADAGPSYNDITVTGVTPTATNGLMEETSFTSQVATFTDPIDFGGSPDPASDYVATINWGDGSSSAGTIALTNPTAVWPASGIYTVTGTHTYPEDTVTPYAITITVSNIENGANSDDQNAVGTTTATVIDSGGPNDITGTGIPINMNIGSAFSGNVATFTDPYSNGGNPDPATTFPVTIAWGDGNSSAGTVTLTSSTSGTGYKYTATYTVSGTHTYSSFPSSGLTITINGDDSGTPATTTATVDTVELTDNGPNPSIVGNAVSFTVTVPGTGSGVPNGETVQLEDASNGNAVVGSGTLSSGSATISVSGLSVGSSATTHNIFAVYGGDTNYAAGQSGTVAQVVDPIQVVSAVTNGDYIPINGASESGNTVTLTSDGLSGFSANNQIVVAGFSGANAGYNGSWTISSVSGNQIQYNDTNAGLGTLANQTAPYAISANTTSDLQPGSGANHQRSMVDSIAYTFNTPVNLTASAIIAAITSQSVTYNGPAGHATAAPNVVLTSLNGGTIWVVTFATGNGNSVVGHSIADGVYDVTLNSADVTAVAGGSTMTTTRAKDTFYRLFGDFNADKRVNTSDANKLNSTFGLTNGTTGFLMYFDSNSDGRINTSDSNAFNSRFGSSWSGFATTI